MISARCHSADDVNALAHRLKSMSTDPSDMYPAMPGQTGAPALCRYFLQGFCSKGSRCVFRHSMDAAPHMEPVLEVQAPVPKQHVPTAAPIPTHAAHEQDHRRSLSEGAPDFDSLEQLAGRILSLCKDQHGCRFLQEKIVESDVNLKLVFDEIYHHFPFLMTDPFGNYLCQRIIVHCNSAQRTQIVAKVSQELVGIAENIHGTRAVQTLIQQVSDKEQIALVTQALRGNVVRLIKDLNGNHVIQKCLHCFAAEDNQVRPLLCTSLTLVQRG